MLMMDPNIIVSDLYPMNDYMVLATYSYIKESMPINAGLSIPTACFTTSYARCHLYEYMSKLSEKQVYF